MLTIDNPSKFDWANMDLSDCCEGNAMDTYFTLKLFDLIMDKLGDQPVMNLIENVVMPSLETFAEMEYNGLDVDPDALESVGKQLRSTNMDEEDFLYTCKSVTKSDNLSSNNDLIEILYTREDGMGLYPPDKTAKGKPSVSAPTLKLLLEHIDLELESRG
jgi:DNA polymerase-1|tara:strand:- start:93 stop:572 length:480 start_codon:yes stop_codon:yes gene_type:complete